MPTRLTQQSIMQSHRMLLAFFLLLGLVAITGCEESVAPDDIPYVERMVVYGIITAGKPADSIRFTRTLPLNTQYNTTDAELTDVVASIEVGGKQYPLRHIGNGLYNADGLAVVVGERYTLRAAWKGLSVTAATTVPISPTVDSIATVDGQYFEGNFSTFAIWAYTRSMKGTAYSIIYDLTDTVNDIHYTSSYDYVDDVWHWRDTTTNGHVVVKTYDHFFSPGNNNVFKGNVTVVAWDEPYYDYYRTYYYGNNDDLFGSSQRTINWNIEGDGIGVFIGQSATEVEWK